MPKHLTVEISEATFHKLINYANNSPYSESAIVEFLINNYLVYVEVGTRMKAKRELS